MELAESSGHCRRFGKAVTIPSTLASSPDMNPIENLWIIIAGGVYANDRQFDYLDDLKEEIRASWD